MKLTTGVIAIALMVGGTAAVAQNPDAIDNARSTVKQLQQKQAAAPTTTASAKPAPGAPAPAVKPAVIPGSSPASARPVVVAAAAKPAVSAENQLQHVTVVPGSHDIQIEISSSHAVTPRVSKLSSPARVLVELPETAVGTAQSRIPVGSGGVKGVRIGMDGKNPPTTSVVIDLDKALAFDLAPGPAGKTVLILHTEESGVTVAKTTVAKPAVAPTTAKTAVAKPITVAKVAAPAPKAVAVPVKVASAPAKVSSAPVKVAAAKPAPAPKVAVAVAPVKADAKTAKSQPKNTVVAKAAPAPEVVPSKSAEAPKPKPEEKKWAMSGKRDPFFSPVVQQQGSGCSTGKKCLEIGAINLRGVIKADSGFIAVVTNNLNKAYFLRENDPVFNGYVVKITGDSVTFQETIQDKLGKSFTREVVKKIFTPAV